MSEERVPSPIRRTVTRRMLLGSGGLLAGGLLAQACSSPQAPVPVEGDVTVPLRPPTPPEELPGAYAFFTDEEARAVEAVVARIVPGSDEDPGAVQAGVPRYIDSKLARFESFAEPTYLQQPFAAGVEPGEEPPPGTVGIPRADLYRYGYQSGNTPHDVYRAGLPALDRYSQTRFGTLFAELSEDRQDAVLMVLEASQQQQEDEGSSGGAGGVDEGQQGGGGSRNGPPAQDVEQARQVFGDVDPGEFFTTVRVDTIEGMFSDPVYGGNRDLVGWRLVGYPGAQRSYSPEEMLHGTTKQRQGLAGLPAMNPDRSTDAGLDALEQQHGHRVHP